MGHKISKEQIDPGVKDHIMSFIGDVADLETEVNTDIISAVNSLMVDRVDNAENMGKLANAIGEPVTANHSVDEVVEGLGEMLSTFKTNMMNSGVTVESGDKFKQLIDKIKGLTEGEGNKGIQFATMIGSAAYSEPSINVKRYVMDLDINFTPSYIFVDCQFNYSIDTSYTCKAMINNINLPSFQGTNASAKISISSTDLIGNTLTWDVWGHYNLTNIDNLTYYAIGVGEEDTTLRDSLASILQEEGVSVTEEDDMASLITKVDEEFDRKNGFLLGTLNIISATELPSTGIENQICVITDNPVDEFIVSQFTEDMTDVGDAICLDLATNERSDNRLVMADNGRVKLYYYINRVVQSGNAKETYVYKNNQWVLLVEGLVYLLLDGVDMNNATFGDIYIYNCEYTKIDKSTGEICLGTAVQSIYQHEASCFSFANKINIDDYTKLTLRIKVSNIEREPNIVVGLATSKAISGASSTDSGYNNWGNTGKSFTAICNGEVYTEIGSSYPENEYFTLEVDISEMTGTGYLCIGIEDNISSFNWVRINTIGIQ